MKNKRAILTFLLAIFLLSACSPHPDAPKLKIGSDVEEVKVSIFKEFGRMNEDYQISFVKKQDIKVFVNAINRSRPVGGDVDMSEADYDLLLIFKDGTTRKFHLWASAEYPTGTIMTTEDTASAYTLSGNTKEKIRKLLSGLDAD